MRMWLRKRIVFQSSLIAAAFLVVGAAAAWYVLSLQRSNSELLEMNVAGIRAADEIEIVVRQARHDLEQYLISHNEVRLEAALKKQPELTTLVDQARALSRTEQETRFIEEVEAGLADFFARLEEHTEGEEEAIPAEAIRSLADGLLSQVVLPRAHEFFELNEQQVIETSQRNLAIARRAAWGFVLLGVCGAVAGVFAGLAAARGITRSVFQLTLPIKDVAGALDEIVGPIEVTAAPSFDDLESTLQAVSAKVEAVVKELQQRHREVIHADQLAAVGQLAAGMAHELRNPLMCIKTLVQAARRRGESAQLDAEDLEVMEIEVNRLDKQLQAFLDFARPPRLEAQEADLAQIVAQSAELVRKKAESRSVTVDCRLPDEPLPIDVDAAQIRQVVLNLLLNALDAVENGGSIWVEADGPSETPAIGAGGSPSPGMVRLRVSDNGHGLPGEDRDRVCEPFFSTKNTGLGLGLAVSKRIVDAHRGELVAGDREGGGAVFEVRLPLQCPAPVAEA